MLGLLYHGQGQVTGRGDESFCRVQGQASNKYIFELFGFWWRCSSYRIVVCKLPWIKMAKDVHIRVVLIALDRYKTTLYVITSVQGKYLVSKAASKNEMSVASRKGSAPKSSRQNLTRREILHEFHN